jgi:cephalosporin hydroxylase
MTPYEKFKQEGEAEIASLGRDEELAKASLDWMAKANRGKYSYHFEWLGRPIIQYPQDIVAMQELIWRVQPDLIIETGIAHGGSLIFSASMLELNAACGGPADAMVLGVDIDIRDHNREAIEKHPLARRISMIQGSSIAPDVVDRVRLEADRRNRVLVSLDSNHTHDHVLAELTAYAPLTTKGSYCVVFDTVVEDLPADAYPAGRWGRGNNPKTAVNEYLLRHPEFEVDLSVDHKIQISVAPRGYLRRVR